MGLTDKGEAEDILNILILMEFLTILFVNI